jgi:hypothetical protein
MDRPVATVICMTPFYFPSQKDYQQNLLHRFPSTRNRVIVGTSICAVRARRRLEKEAVRHLRQGHTTVGL